MIEKNTMKLFMYRMTAGVKKQIVAARYFRKAAIKHQMGVKVLRKNHE